MNGNGWQTFLRMANLYNPAQMGGDMPSELPVGPRQPQLINRQGPSQSMPGQYQDTPWGNIDEEVTVGVEEPQSSLEAFRQNVLNPPQRKNMTYPKNTLAGLTEALKIAATPTDFEKNRVFVNGDPYQQVRAFKDPTTGEVKFINKYKQPGFMEQVMKAMPAAVSPAVDILNQPYQDEVADWEMRNKGLKEAIGAESAMALAKQREAQAGYTGQRADLERDKIAISRMTAEERVRASQLNTLTDVEKIQMLQDGRITMADINNAAAMQRVEAQQAGAMERTQAQQAGATQRTQMQQTGATQRTGMQQTGAAERNAAAIAAANERNAATIAARQAGAGVTGQLPTQQRVALQNRAQEVVNQNPEWAEYVSFNEQGFPVISMPDTKWGPGQSPEDIQTYNQIYEAIYGTARPSAAPVTPPTTPQTTKPTTPQSTKPAPKPAPKTGGAVEMITPDGKSTRMVPANMVETAKKQGYKPKGKG